MKKLLILLLLIFNSLVFAQRSTEEKTTENYRQSLLELSAELTTLSTNEEVVENKVKTDKIFKKYKDDSLKVRLLTQYGDFFLNKNDEAKGMSYTMEALKIAELNSDSSMISTINYRLGFYYFYKEQIDLSIERLKRCRETFPESGEPLQESIILMALGVVINTDSITEEGVRYQEEALEIKRKAKAWKHIPVSLNNMAEVYCSMGDTVKALKTIERSIFLADSVQELAGYYYAVYLKGEILTLQNKHVAAIPYLEKGIKWWEETESLKDLPRAYRSLADAYKGANKTDLGLLTLEKLLAVKDTLFNESKQASARDIEEKYQSEKKELELQKEKEEKLWAQKETALTKKSERKNIIIFIIVIVFLVLSIYYFYRRYKTQQRDKEIIMNQKVELEIRSKEIQDSIFYSKRLQSAIMPSVQAVNACFSESFIYYKPKDIVAGDFYWMETSGDITFLASADCTGHGVPGALVSVVCSNSLNRTIHEFDITEPARVLDKTRELVIETFAKSGEAVRDGMDIALCAFNKSQLVYAGAHNPLWIIRENRYLSADELNLKTTCRGERYSLIEFKADKQPIGLFEGIKPFTQTEISLRETDTIYFFTDGYADQFGGEKGKKFKYKPFKQFLLNISNLPLSTQKMKLEERFISWKGDFDQVDDVCVIGVKVLSDTL